MLENFLTLIYNFLQSYGIFGVFLSMFIENIGIPLPTEIGYLIGIGLIAKGEASFTEILFVVTLGHVIGSLVSYEVGIWGGVTTKNIIKIGKIAQTQKKLKSWYSRYGNITVFIARFVGYVRPWSSFVAGFSDVDFWPFLIWTFIGSLIFNIGVLLFSKSLLLVWNKYEFLHLTIIIIGFSLFFGFLFYELIIWLKNKLNKSY